MPPLFSPPVRAVIRVFVMVSCLNLVTVRPVAAADPLLTIALPGGAGIEIELSREALLSFPSTTIITENEFVDGRVAYTGPLVRDVIAGLGVEQPSVVRFLAANDYFVDIPVSDFEAYDVILALEAEGQPLSRRGRGPIWLMYPLSENPHLIGDAIYTTRLIWQVVRMEIR